MQFTLHEGADRIGPVRHASARVRCPERAQPAVVSMFERAEPGHCMRFVAWCSLRACDQCAEACLRAAGD